MEHVLRSATVARVNAVLEVDEVGVADAVRTSLRSASRFGRTGCDDRGRTGGRNFGQDAGWLADASAVCQEIFVRAAEPLAESLGQVFFKAELGVLHEFQCALDQTGTELVGRENNLAGAEVAVQAVRFGDGARLVNDRGFCASVV